MIPASQSHSPAARSLAAQTSALLTAASSGYYGSTSVAAGGLRRYSSAASSSSAFTASAVTADNKRTTQTASPKILTHVDADGKAHMVDVGHKRPTQRAAVARATVYVGAEIAQLIQANSVAKGDVLSVSQIAGIVAAKRTSELIPLCHNIALQSVNVRAQLDAEQCNVIIHATVKCEGRTGVEMEALVACATAALTIYDMCKALSQDIVIRDVMLLRKTGGKLNYQRRSDGAVEREERIVLRYKPEPPMRASSAADGSEGAEIFVPTHI